MSNIFWLEYLYYIMAMLAILVSVSAASLFLLTLRVERQLRTVWRVVGFLSLAAAFILFILERKIPGFKLVALTIETIGFFFIYRGVRAEPKLAHLAQTTEKKAPKPKEGLKEEQFSSVAKNKLLPLYAFIIIVVFAIAYIFFGIYLASALVLISTICIILTIRIQVRRYQTEGTDRKTRLQNLYPLLAYIFLLIRGIFLILYRLPDLNIVFLRTAKLEYSYAWEIGVIFGILGFLFLGVWAWNFIKLRIFLRTYVTFLAIAIIVSSLGSLVFTTLVFRIIERNNLELMTQGAHTQETLVLERENTALFIAKTMANDMTLVDNAKASNFDALLNQTSQYLTNSGVDTIRVYNAFGEVIASPSDPRDKGRVFNNDNNVTYAITEKKQIKTLGTESGVLSDMLVARSIHPLLDKNNATVGAVEVGYKFDNAFVDFSQVKTGLDVTIYTGKKQSATTIKTLDGVSRWVGTDETDQNVISAVLDKGETYSTALDRLGRRYYSAFAPVRDVNGKIIGMISVGSPTSILLEDTRQQLISTFLIVTLVSLLAALLGYVVIQSFEKKMRTNK